MDAVGSLGDLGHFLGEGQHRVVVLQNGLVQVGNAVAHHGTAVEHLARLLGEAAAEVHQLLHGSADDDLHVLGFLDHVAVHGEALGGQGHACRQVLAHKGHRGDVHHNHAHIRGQAGEGDLPAGAVLDENFFRTLGVTAGQLLYLDAGSGCGLHLGDGLGLVALDADDALGNLQILHHRLDAVQDVLGVLQEAAVVRGDVGLALGAVDEEGVDLVQILGGQLHRRGEARAAQTHQAAGPDGILEGLEIGDSRGRDGRVHRLLAVWDDDHSGLRRAVGGGDGDDAVHCAGHAGVDVRGDKAARLAHHRAHKDLVALGHLGCGGGADVLSHGQDDLRGQRHLHGLLIGSPLFVRDLRALRRSFEKFAHVSFRPP